MSFGKAIFWINAIKNAREQAQAQAPTGNSPEQPPPGKIKSLSELHAKLTREQNRKK